MKNFNLSIQQSGDGYELLDTNGEVIAWTLDRTWALRILAALESVEWSATQKDGDQQ